MRTLSQEKVQIENLAEYIELKNVRMQTGRINGEIYYNGRTWTKDEYEAEFPEPVLKYKSAIQLDGTQIEK